MTPQLRYDEIPWEVFRSLLSEQLSGKGKKTLVSDSRLRDFKFYAIRNKQGANAFLDEDPKKNRSFWLYFLREEDLVNQTYHQYMLFHTDSDGAEDLLRIAQRFRVDLKGKGTETFFHIDPRYGAVTGSSLETVTRFSVKERPGCYVQLVITQDPDHTLVSIQNSVDREDRQRFVEIFEKYNHVTPIKPSLLRKIFVSQPPKENPPGWTYRFLSDVASLLFTRYHLLFQNISLIYEHVPESEIEGCMLDKKYSSVQTAGTSRFFTSTEELLQ